MTQQGAAPRNLVLSIDLPNQSAAGDGGNTAALRLLGLLRQHGMRATWSTPDFRHFAVEKVLADSQEHEVAYLCSHLASAEANSKQASQQLMRALIAAGRCGLTPRSLALTKQSVNHQLRLLAKHEFCMVRGRTDQPTHSLEPSQPQVLRYGVWAAPVSYSATTTNHWSIRSPLVQARRALKRLELRGGLLHISLDVGQLRTATERTWDQLQLLLANAAERRNRCGLESLTLQQLAERHCGRSRETGRSRSILKAA